MTAAPAINSKDARVSEILEAGLSPRSKRIDTYLRYYEGTQYDGRPAFMDMTSEAPLAERAPCVVYPAVRNAVGSFVAMCLGDRRFPAFSTLQNEDDSTFDKRFGLSEAESTVVDASITKIIDQTQLKSVALQILETGLAAGSAVLIASVLNGKLKVAQLDPRWCEPTYKEDNPEELDAIEVRYRYVERDRVDPETGRKEDKVYQYRRRIDSMFDTVFHPVEVKDKKDFPVPSRPKSKYAHNFGFVPAVWWRALAPVADYGDVDGRPVHWGLTGLVDAVNFALSQRHRAALYCGDPQIVETGVDAEGVSAPIGRATAGRQLTIDGSGWGEPLMQRRSGSQSVRKKGVGVVWRYESPDAKVHMLTLPSDALKAIEQDAEDNIEKLNEALGHVTLSPETIISGAEGADISGRAMAIAMIRQTSKCGAIRDDFALNCLLPLLNILFRICLSVPEGLYLAGVEKLRAILIRFEQEVSTADGVVRRWFEPAINVRWPDWFPSSDADAQTRSITAAADLAAGLVTRKTAVEYIKSTYGIENIDQYLEVLERELEDRANAANELAAAVNTKTSKTVEQVDSLPSNGTPQTRPPRGTAASTAPAGKESNPGLKTQPTKK